MKRLTGAWVLLAAALVAGCAGGAVRDGGALPAAPAAVVAEGKAFINARAVIFVRHADIDVTLKASMGNAVPLLAAGEERAKGLVTMLKDAGVTRVVVTPAVRTQATGRPLAEALKLKEEDGGATAASVLKLLTETAKPADVIVVVEHHSNLPGILAGLGFERETEAVDATEFDRVYVVLPEAGTRTYRLMRMRYGGKWE